MVAVGEKIRKNGYELEVKKINKISDLITEIRYIVRHGARELTESTIYVVEGENAITRLNETLTSIVNAIKRVTST